MKKRLKMGKLKHVHWNIIFSNFLIYPKNNIEYMNLTTWMRYESRGIMAGPSVTLIVTSEASDPTFKTIYFQYYTLVVLILIKYIWNSEEAAEQISRGGKSS